MIPLLELLWTAESNQIGAGFGYSVASAGDVNGDGISDVVVGSPYYDNGQFLEGRAFVYLGSSGGLDASAAWTAEGNQPNAYFGESVSGAGDVNGDGYDDIVVGAHGFDIAVYDEGRAFLYLGGAAGLDATAAWVGEGSQTRSEFASSVASAGDVNADGYDDLIVGEMWFDNGSDNEGRAVVFLGSPTGLAPTPVWTGESNQASAFLGEAVAGAGDVNNDGFDDVIVGAPAYDDPFGIDEGRAFVYHGSASGLAPTPAWSDSSHQFDSAYGYGVRSAGDLNADGYDDVVVGAGAYDNPELNEGRAYVYQGSLTGLEATAAWTKESNQPYGGLGGASSGAGDFNNDGFHDLVVGFPGFRLYNPYDIEGKVLLFIGSALGLPATPAFEVESGSQTAVPGFGGAVSSAGDVNGDGYDDIIVGSPNFTVDEVAEGWAFVFSGACYDDTIDTDGDTIGDLCDACVGADDLLDADTDQVPDACDLCPTAYDPEQADDDGDGIGDACDSCPLDAPDLDADGACDEDDCDDHNVTVFPGAPQLCDGLDNACVGEIPLDELDADLDGSFPCSGDCDDDDPARSVETLEVCGDAIDNDCDVVIDEECLGEGETSGGCGCVISANRPPLAFAAILLALLLPLLRNRAVPPPRQGT